MSFEIRVNGETAWKTDLQALELSVSSRRGEVGRTRLDVADGVIDIYVIEAAPGGPMRLDHLENAQRRERQDRAREGEAVGVYAAYPPGHLRDVKDSIENNRPVTLNNSQGHPAYTAGSPDSQEDYPEDKVVGASASPSDTKAVLGEMRRKQAIEREEQGDQNQKAKLESAHEVTGLGTKPSSKTTASSSTGDQTDSEENTATKKSSKK